ncbi:hypothetical protein GPECTOR_75g776 [Gonium pectorale]|uniref:DNA 3'-5' helicase n=1 Tax=Gonium pectorale TaxID=33097 RepID=A0A150G2F3_GONPE|nr:hypothetical protein GPECTOR_75g776 [Gonium pectorale]|eukprot:KXZ44052.1 hypothetical protein GPECTOR_75g776 [Gonium pectorale]
MRMGLNDEQLRAAISESDKPLLIVAGAGTGKTSTLISRIVHLVRDEVRERLHRNGVNARSLTAATFHSFCFSILRWYHKVAGFSQCPTVWTDSDLKRAVALAIRLQNLDVGRVDMAAWLGLPDVPGWADILKAVEKKHPDIWESCGKAAQDLVAKQQKSKRKKGNGADTGAGAAQNTKKGAKKQRTNNGPAASTNTATGDGAAAGPAGAGASDGAAEGFTADADNNLLYRAEFIKLVYSKLQTQYSPGTEAVIGAKPKAALINARIQWLDRFKRTGADISGYGMQFALFYSYVHAYYDALLRAANAIDFNDMLLLVDKLITEHDWILRRLQKKHQYVLVDEYQDCSPQQVRFVELLSGHSGRLTAVGDDAQSIYRFRGAMPGVFEAFRQFHSGQLQQTLLERNYRSRPKILADSAGVTRKVLRPTKEDTADKIQELVKEGKVEGPGGVAVLYRCFKMGGARTHSQLQSALRSRGIPFVLVRDKSVFERKEVQDTLAYLRLAANPTDDAAFVRVFNTPPRRLGDQKAGFMTMLRDLQARAAARACEALDMQRRELGAGRGRNGVAPQPDGPAAGPAAQRPPAHSYYGLCCALLQQAGGGAGAGGDDDLLGYQLAPSHQGGVRKLVEVVEDLRRAVWQLGPAGAIKRVLDLTGYVEWYAEQKATKERLAQDAAEQLAMSPGGAAKAAAEKGAKAMKVQAGQEGNAGGDEDDKDDEEGEEEDDDDDDLPPLPAGLPPEPVELGERAQKMLGLKLLFREAKLFASKWQVPSRAFAMPPHPHTAAEAPAGGPVVPELFALAAHAVMSSFSGEDVQAALHTAHPLTGLPQVTPEVLEQMYAEQRRGPLVLRDFLAHVALSDREVEAGGAGAAAGAGGAKSRQAVTISTIHAAKGLEFPVVFVARWAEGYLPTLPRPDKSELNRLSPQEQAEYIERDAEEHREEERRLAHVAVTRAMERLFITSIRVHRVQGKSWLVPPSSIELPADPQVVERRPLPQSAEEAAMEQEAVRNMRVAGGQQ